MDTSEQNTKERRERARRGIEAVLIACQAQHRANEKPADPQQGLPFVAPCICGRNSSGCDSCLGLRDLALALDMALTGHYADHPNCDCQWADTGDLMVQFLLGRSPRAFWDKHRPPKGRRRRKTP